MVSNCYLITECRKVFLNPIWIYIMLLYRSEQSMKSPLSANSLRKIRQNAQLLRKLLTKTKQMIWRCDYER